MTTITEQIAAKSSAHALHMLATSEILASCEEYNREREESSKISFNKKMKVLWLERTCEMFPDQYEGKLEDGRMIYIRLRHQQITADISIYPTDDIDDVLEGIQMFCQELNQDTVNRSEIQELFRNHGLEVDWGKCEYIDPYRLPYNYNYSLLGMIQHQIYCRTFGLKLKWGAFKRSLNYQARLALRKREFTKY